MTDLTLRTPALTPRHFCTFRLAAQLYGIELSAVREVATALTITPVPHSPPSVRGLANLRSRIYLILDLRPILGLTPADTSPDTRYVILKDQLAENIGILVDAGGDIVSVSPDAIESATRNPAPDSTDKQPLFVTGICKLPAELLMVVDPLTITDHVKTTMA